MKSTIGNWLKCDKHYRRADKRRYAKDFLLWLAADLPGHLAPTYPPTMTYADAKAVQDYCGRLFGELPR